MKKLMFALLVLASCTGGNGTPITADTIPVSSSSATAATAAAVTTVATMDATDAGTPVCPTPAQLTTDLTAAAQSDVISLSGINPINCPEITMTQTWSGGKLVFSDAPETVTAKGKLYEDGTLPATAGQNYHRLFVYHVNGMTAKSRFTVLIKNLGTVAGTLTVQKKGIAGPSTSYLYTGKLAFQRWLDSTAGIGTNVGAGATVRLDTTFDVTNVTQSNLYHGIWDYSFTQPHQVTICMISTTDNPLTVCPTLAVLPRDTHKRGTFPYADKVYDSASGVVINTIDGIQQFPLSGGTTNDEYSVGVDVTDGSPMTNGGNYGILYRIHLNTASGDSKNLGFLLNPRAGQWGGAVYASPGLTPGGKFLIPAGSGSTGDNTKGAVEGKYAPGTALATWAQFMPTGGSSFPLRFVAVPF